MVNSKTLKALHAEWRKLSPNLEIEPVEGETPAQAERRARLEWTNEKLPLVRRPLSVVRCDGPLARDHGQITSWKDLSAGQARYLIKRMREESGDGPAYRAVLIGRLAAELIGAEWDTWLSDRLGERFRVNRPEDLTPAQAHAEIEELLSRIGRRDGIGIEEVRARCRLDKDLLGGSGARFRGHSRERGNPVDPRFRGGDDRGGNGEF